MGYHAFSVTHMLPIAMPQKKLTTLFMDRITPPESGRVEYFDTTFPAFGVRVSSKGRKSWIVFYRFGGKQARLTLGTYPGVSLADARDLAREALTKVEKGIDPADAKKASRISAGTSVGDVTADFIERYAKRRTKQWKESKRILDREVVAKWGTRPVDKITRRDVQDLVEGIIDRGSPVMAKQTLAAVRKCLGWAVDEGYIDFNPAGGVKAAVKVPERERVLTDQEITKVWAGFDTLGYPFGPLFKLMLITAQREGEVAGMRWGDIDLDAKTWTLPSAATKSGRAHQVPLTDLAIQIIQAVPKFTGPHVFSGTNGDRPVSGFSHAKKRVDIASDVTDWRLHDLRRTAASNMAKQKTPINVLSKVLNHTDTKHQGGITAVYNRYGYENEKREALTAWAKYLKTLI